MNRIFRDKPNRPWNGLVNAMGSLFLRWGCREGGLIGPGETIDFRKHDQSFGSNGPTMSARLAFFSEAVFSVTDLASADWIIPRYPAGMVASDK